MGNISTLPEKFKSLPKSDPNIFIYYISESTQNFQVGPNTHLVCLDIMIWAFEFVWMIKIQISCLGSLKNIKDFDLDLKNPPRILNL